MANKKISIKPKASNQAIDSWVSNRELLKQEEIMKRMTFDLPLDIHSKFKVKCAQNNVKMTDVLRELIEEYAQK